MKVDRKKEEEIPLFPLKLSQAEINYQATDYFNLCSRKDNQQTGEKHSFVDIVIR